MDSSSSRWAAPAVSAGGVLASAAIFLLCMTFAHALIFLHHRYFSTGVVAPSGRRRARARSARTAAPPAKGVDPELLRSLQVTVYRAADDVGIGLVDCAVCLAGLEDGEEARFLPGCGHGFHAGCVDRWLASHTTCPLCRVTVVGKPDPEASTSTSLPPVPPEPANYAANLPLPASVLLGVPDQTTLGAVTAATEGVLVIDVPESMMVAAAPRDASKSPGVAGLRSVKRLWSFGRQGPSGSTTPCAGGSGTADVERRISITCATPR
uniref:RING-type E3 ubiquitin transferase n=1 Tax=Aegilops tauschii TaxID=37682 RepID=N1QQX7_AEGTA